jgi:biofilm protein TabA
MILGSIHNLETDKPTLARALVQGLEYLKSTDFSKLGDGRYEIGDGSMYNIIQEYRTSPPEEKKAETHRKYIDIQYIYEGEEMIGFAPVNPINEILEDLLAEKDALFYKTVANETAMVLAKGMYAVFFPTDIHRPGCNSGGGTMVKKVVLKIPVELV